MPLNLNRRKGQDIGAAIRRKMQNRKKGPINLRKFLILIDTSLTLQLIQCRASRCEMSLPSQPPPDANALS